MAYRIWCGFAFEDLCLKHVPQIKKSLGISGVYTEQSIWRREGDDSISGAQIDLVLDRAGQCINLVEVKFSNAEFVVDKKYPAELENKKQTFAAKIDTRKSLFLTMITNFGVKKNEYALHTLHHTLTMDVLFEHG